MRVYEILLMPLWHPIILSKSNEFNMAVVSVKRSININSQPGGRVLPIMAYTGEPPPKRGTFFRLEVYERVGIYY